MIPFYPVADLHLRRSVPRCRPQDKEIWFAHQQERIRWLFSFEDGAIVIAGDIFDAAIMDPLIFNMFADEVNTRKNPVYYMPGNHDLLNHNHAQLDASTVGILSRISGNILPMGEFCDYIPFGGKEIIPGRNHSILCIHQLVFPNKGSAPPNTKGITAENLLTLYPQYSIILTGDNHSHFLYEKDGRYVLNPGCFTKQDVSYKDEALSIFRVDGMDIKEIPLPPDNDCIEDAYIISAKEREDRGHALVEKLKSVKGRGFDFKKNVYDKINTMSTLRTGTISLLHKILDGNKG